MKKLLITGGVLVLAVVSFFVGNQLHQNNDVGTITISIVDQYGNMISSNRYQFDDEDTLLSILEEHHEVSCASNDFQPVSCDTSIFMGHVLLDIDNVQTNWINAYIAIYVNNAYSTYGIDDIVLQDGNAYRFQYTVVGAE